MNPSEELFKAASEGNVPRLHELIAGGCPVDARPDTLAPTPLAGALLGRRFEAMRELLRAGADVREVRCEGKPALIYAYAVVRDLSLFRSFLEAGARPDDADDEGRPCLFYTLSANDYETSNLLISRGADANPTVGNETLLSHFVRLPKVVEFLLGKGADPNRRNPGDNKTALMVLVSSPEAESDLVEALLGAGADVGATAGSGAEAVDCLDMAKRTLAEAQGPANATLREARLLEGVDEQARARIGEVEAAMTNLRKTVRLLKQKHPKLLRRLFG